MENGVMRTQWVAFACALILTGRNGFAHGAQPDSDRNIAATCASCHGTNGVSAGGNASLAGRSKTDLVAKVQEFRTGRLAGTVMPQLAKGYTDEQIDLAAAWFAAQPPVPAK